MAGPLDDFLPSFFYGNPQNQQQAALSYEALQSRRRIAEALLGRRSAAPKTLGEGLTFAGEAIANIAMQRSLDEAERGQAERDASILGGMPRGEGVSYSAPGTPSTAELYTRPPIAPQPQPQPQPPAQAPAGPVITNPDDAGGIFGKNTRILAAAPGPVITNPDDAGGIFGKNTRILAAAPADRGGDEGNPPIVTDIQPAPTLRSALPSQEPIPAPVELSLPGLAPRPPDLLGPSQAMLYRDSIINSGRYSPHVAEALKLENLREEQQRKDIQTKQQADYEFNRARHYKTVDEYEKWIREGKLDEHVKRVGLEKAQSDLEEAYYKRGVPREQARVKADLDIQQTQQGLAAGKAPEVMSIGDNRYQWDQRTGTYKDITPTADPSNIKMSETQAKTLKAFERATFANAQLRNSDSVLAGFVNSGAAGIPAVGNYLVSPEYQRLNSARETWGMSVLRDESGAAIGIDEVRKKLRTYFPVPGDNPATILDKKLRRRYEEQSLVDSLGHAKPLADRFLQQREGRRVNDTSAKEGKIFEDRDPTSPTFGKRRVNVGGYWEDL